MSEFEMNEMRQQMNILKKKLEQQGVALNPALLADDPQTMELDKVKYPYIELTSTGSVYIPYGTKFYPIY